MPCTFLLLMAHISLEAQEMRILPDESTVQWKATKVTGAHDGKVAIAEGTVVVKDGVLMYAEVVMDMSTITCDDIQSEGSNARLVTHLKSADLFDVENHGTARFSTSSVEKIDGRANAYRVTGDLTIKGITEPNTFEVSAIRANGALRVAGTLVFDRSKYDVRHGSSSFFEGLGDRIIHDPVTLNLDILAR